jgi:outer membrane protein assembly factor BamB
MDGRCPTGISRSPFVGPQTASVKWTKKICDQFTSHVMIAASGSLYGGCADGTLNALDPVAGAPKWTFTSLKDMSNPVAIDSAGDIQVAALDSNFYVFLPSTGVRQATKALPTAPQGSSALLPNGDSCFGGADGKIYCLDGSGNQTTSLLLDATMYAAVGPVAPDGTLYASAFDPGLAKDGVLYALTMGSPPTVKWQMPIGPATGAIIEPMAGALYLGGWDGKIRRVPATGGPATWTINPGDRDGVGALGADGTLYATGATFPSPTFHAINPDGSVRWNFAPNDYVAGVVVGADGLIYIGTGGNDGNVYALEPVAGAVVWQFQIGASRQEPNSIASDGTLYVTTSDGNLFAFGP